MHRASSIGIKTEIHSFSLKSSWYQHCSSTPYMPKNVSLLLVLWKDLIFCCSHWLLSSPSWLLFYLPISLPVEILCSHILFGTVHIAQCYTKCSIHAHSVWIAILIYNFIFIILEMFYLNHSQKCFKMKLHKIE